MCNYACFRDTRFQMGCTIRGRKGSFMQQLCQQQQSILPAVRQWLLESIQVKRSKWPHRVTVYSLSGLPTWKVHGYWICVRESRILFLQTVEHNQNLWGSCLFLYPLQTIRSDADLDCTFSPCWSILYIQSRNRFSVLTLWERMAKEWQKTRYGQRAKMLPSFLFSHCCVWLMLILIQWCARQEPPSRLSSLLQQSSTKKKAQQVLFPIGVIIGALVPRRSKMVESYNKITLFLTSNMQLQHVPMTPSLH